MKKIKLFMLSAMALLLSFACISCDNGITTKLNKLKTTYDSIYIPYNSYGPNYQITFPLDELVPEMNQFYYGQVIDVSFDYYAINEYPNFMVQLVSTDGTADNWWRELAETKKISKEDKLFSGDFGSFKSSFVINHPSSNTDFSKYCLVLKFGLRDGESPDYHVDTIEFLIKNLKVRTNNEMVSFADGRVVAIPTTEGIYFELKWTNDSFWSDHRYDCIYITNGLSISISGEDERPKEVSQYKELLYPFTSKNGGTYEISYLGQTKKMHVPSGIGEINIEPVNNIELAFDCTEWPVAKINNLNNSTIPIILGDAYESVTDDIESGNLSPYCYVTLWGGENWDNWLRSRNEYNFDVFNKPYDLLFAYSDDPTDIVNSIINKGGYWYESGLCFEFGNKKYGDCVYRNVYGSERISCANSSMQDFINAAMTYYDTHSSNCAMGGYFWINSTDLFPWNFEAGKTYHIEWIDGWNYDKSDLWNNTFNFNGFNISNLTDCAYVLYDIDGETVLIENDDDINISYTFTVSGTYKFQPITYGGSGVCALIHIYYEE